MSQTSSLTTDFVLGEYVTDSPGGLRTYPYSVNPTTNPLTYQSLRTLNEIHGWPIVSRHTGYADVLTEAIGEVWANMLHTVYAVLVEEHGFSTRKLTDVDGSEGNIVFMHLFIDALSLQPCNPSCEPIFLMVSSFVFLMLMLLSRAGTRCMDSGGRKPIQRHQ